MVRVIRPTADFSDLLRELSKTADAWERVAKAQMFLSRGQITNFIDDQARALNNLNKSLSTADKRVKTLTLSWKSFRRLVGVQLAHQAISRFITAIGESTQRVIELEKRIGEVQTISGNAILTTEIWTKELQALSDAWGIDIINQVEGAYQSLSNQVVESSDVFQFMAEANRFAVTAVTSTSVAVDLLTAGINAFGKDAADVNQISAELFKTIELGRVRAEELATAYGRIAVPANKLGITSAELNAAISATTIQGFKYSEAATAIRNVFLKLIKPTEEMTEWFSELGVASGEALIGAYGFEGALTALMEQSRGSTTELGKLFGRLRAMIGAFLLSGEGLEKFQGNLAEIEEALDSYDKKADLIMSKSGKRLEIFINQIKNLFTIIAQETVQRAFNFFDYIDTFGLTPIEIDQEIAKNQKKWHDQRLKNINEAHRQELKNIDERSRARLKATTEEAAEINKNVQEYGKSYEIFRLNVVKFEKTITKVIKEQISVLKGEIGDLQDIIDDAGEISTDLQELITQRRLTGLDRPDRLEPETIRKYEHVIGRLNQYEQRLREAATRLDQQAFEKWQEAIFDTMQDAVEFSDQMYEEGLTGPIASGEAFFRYWDNRIRSIQNEMVRVSKQQQKIREEEIKNNEKNIALIKEQIDIVKATTISELFKAEDPEEIAKVYRQQEKALKQLKQYADKYGVDFFRLQDLENQLINLRLFAEAKIDQIRVNRHQEDLLRTEEILKKRLDAERKIHLERIKLAQQFHEQDFARNFSVTRRAAGGRAGVDTQLAAVSPDEFIMNSRASRQFYSTLTALNSNIQRFSGGGAPVNYNVGDIHLHPQKASDVNVLAIGKGLRREIRRGRLTLN